MAKISIRSTSVLTTLALLAIGLLYIVETSKKNVKEAWYTEKFAASRLTQKALLHLKNERFENVDFLDNINDPNETGLIGEQYTPITTGSGSLPIKASTMNPNFGGMIVQLLKDAKLKKGDKVAICMTGSFPGLNVAALAAIQTLGIKPIIISSVTASSWGANDPEFTWVDMEHELFEDKIFTNHSIAASMGGNLDIGRALSGEGRDLVEAAIKRNHLSYIHTGSFEGNIAKRIQLFNQHKNIKAFINIGGGVASNGSDINGDAIRAGYHETLKLKDFPDKKGVMFEMAKKNIPIIHLKNVEQLMNTFDLPMEPIPLPEIGKGKLYYSLKYQVGIVGTALFFLVGLLLVTIYLDKKQHALGNEIIKTND